MKLAKNGEFTMNRQEVAEFSAWLNDHPRERFKRFNEVVQAYMNYQQSDFQINEWALDEAQ
ncbi:hypothetical protein EHS13_29010 [Paenibacillus psychroresistens]|uniref:Uncharacterized protein n=1 Tax=Paenibacillus psychroresistens TaxID=1778678 RepID=A0A6B8RS42_9BACL|nr:hypothetical protein [Paenibacillus psychroresistens]QGQ98634.1 hypothetical protein EHS13_29010 [Paenibacillus psychroresistens]